MEGMVKENKDSFSISPRNGKTGWWMMALISLVIGISLPSNSSAAATPFLPIEDKGSSTAQNSVLQSVDSENLTSVQNVANSDSTKNQIQTAKDGKSIPDTMKVIQGEGCDYDPPYWSSHKPFRGQPNVPISQNTFEFMLRDDRSGVDLRTFRLVVDGIDVFANSAGLTLIGNPQKYSVRYKLPANRTFFWGDTVWIKLSVCDLNDPPNCMADSMFFVMEPDLDPPIIIPAGPMPGDINIAVNSPVKLSILDAKAGIDFTSIKLLLNGIDYSDSLTILQGQTPNIIVNSAQRTIFGYNQEVVVFAEVEDLVGNIADTTYSFKVQSEPFPPVITFIYPTRNSDKFLALNDSLVFRIKDVHSQIDTSRTEITLNLNNTLVGSQIIAISSSRDEKEFIYTIRPAAPVKCNMIGQLRVQGFDKSGNMAVDSTQFKFIEDKIGPEIIVIKPQANESEVALDHIIEFEVRDNIAGVDKDLIEVFINGDNRSDSLTIQQVEPLAKRYHISLLNTGYWNDTISVKIVAHDLALTANRTELTYRYFIKRDDQGPLITVINPLPMQEGVLLSHVVEFEVEDILAGVNSDSIKIEVNGIDKTAALIKNEIVSSSRKFRVTLANTGAWNNTISIKIAAHDLSVPPNKSEVNFQYFMAKDLQGPLVTAENPKPNQQNVMPENVKIQFSLEDNSAGLDLSSLKFYVKDKIIAISDLRPLDKNDKEEDRTVHHIGYSYHAGNFSLGEKVRVRVNVMDDAGNPASGDTDYTFTITKDPYPPKIKIIQPLADAKDVNRYLPVILEVTDLESGININSIVLKMNNEVVKPTISPNFTQEFTPRQNFDTSFRVIFNPVLPYNWNSTITASITVEDSVGHPASLTYQFSTQEDRIGPEFINLSPAPNSVDILSNTPISIGIQDLLSGVNIESFDLSINGTL
ncbi:hypothetical protein JW964_16045, partial [candidate division KSB1 bacterium]|nr:hypothetical protein [candidate division KSB1 bacterium]